MVVQSVDKQDEMSEESKELLEHISLELGRDIPERCASLVLEVYDLASTETEEQVKETVGDWYEPPSPW